MPVVQKKKGMVNIFWKWKSIRTEDHKDTEKFLNAWLITEGLLLFCIPC
jgi:hypothetical protein